MVRSFILLALILTITGCASDTVLDKNDCDFTCASNGVKVKDIRHDGCSCELRNDVIPTNGTK